MTMKIKRKTLIIALLAILTLSITGCNTGMDITAATLGEGDTVDCDGTFNRTGGTLTETGGNKPGR